MQFCQAFQPFYPLVHTLNKGEHQQQLFNKTFITMTVVQFKNKPVLPKHFNNLMDDLFAVTPSLLRNGFHSQSASNSVPVNIKETDNSYLLEVIAPGFIKEDFKIDLEEKLLTISAEKKAEAEDKNSKQIRREYQFQAFKRSFTLDDTIDAENISALYVNGVLTLNLPRKMEVKEPVKQITVQ